MPAVSLTQNTIRRAEKPLTRIQRGMDTFKTSMYLNPGGRTRDFAHNSVTCRFRFKRAHENRPSDHFLGAKYDCRALLSRAIRNRLSKREVASHRRLSSKAVPLHVLFVLGRFTNFQQAAFKSADPGTEKLLPNSG